MAEEQQGWRAAPLWSRGRGEMGGVEWVGMGWVVVKCVCVLVQLRSQRFAGIPARRVEAGTW